MEVSGIFQLFGYRYS